MMLYALWRFPSSRWKARHRNSSAVSLHPNTVSSSASDLAVHPRKLLTTTSDQTTNVRLFELQTGRYFAVRESLLFEQQATSHWLFDFIQSPTSFFDCQAALVVLFRCSGHQAIFCAPLLIFVVASHRTVLTPYRVSRNVKSYTQQPRPE